jgi:hypothetical protein
VLFRKFKQALIAGLAHAGGKGTVRRKVVPRSGAKAAGGDDKKLAAALKKLNVQPIAPIEEVNMFLADGNVLHFTAPKGGPIPIFVTENALIRGRGGCVNA